MKVLGYHFQDDVCVCSDGSFPKDDYLQFLLTPKDDCLRVCYNLDWFVSRLCYQLQITESQLKKFWTSGILYPPGTGTNLFFVPHRYLNIKFGKHFGEASYTDVFQYQGDLPFEIDPLDAARKAQEIGQRVYDVLTRLDLHPSTLSSPIAAYQKEILSTLDLPTYKDMPAEVSYYAQMCKKGGWQECFQRGHFQAYDYDITSAFTRHTADLIDTRKGKWVKSDKFFSPAKAPYGFCNGIVDVEKDFNSVIYTHKNKEGQTADYTPTGEHHDFKTNAAISRLYDNQEGRFKVLDGWYWFPDGSLEYPLKDHVERLFEWKQYLKGFDREIIKRKLVGLTGKLGETFPNNEEKPFGKMFNMAWYAWVQDATKIQVADFVISNHAEDNLLSIAVDGCMFDREIPIKESDEMGDWRLNMVAPAFVVSSGVGCIKGKDGKGAFALTYDWLKAQIEANPDAKEYVMTKLTPVTIGNALKNHKVEHLGELEMSERAVILNEVKRMYPEYPRKGSDLMKQYKSEPMDMSILQAGEFSSSEEKE
jgi:hypothetical protein